MSKYDLNRYWQERHDKLADENTALKARVAEMEGALKAIHNHKPDAVDRSVDHDSESCDDCKAMIGHPISHGRCSAWYHLFYRAENKAKDADNRQQYQMRRIASDVLANTTPAKPEDKP